jgi:HAD superfamily hydrolase (TIGR01509 family)
MIPNLDLVIFDCDGVLIDSEMLSVRADRECLAADGINISEGEIIERYTGISWADMLADLTARYAPLAADLDERRQKRRRALFEAELTAIPGVAELLDALACKSCVASSGRPERLRHALELVGLYYRFHPHIYSAVEVARGKPAPDLFLHAASRMGVAPHRTLVIEDSLPGVAAAVAAGMTAIGFTGGSHCRPGHDARLRAQGAAVVAERMEQLLPVLARR